jgi:GTP:adenosylcobinamide-phosphate guanylyltransferase
MQEMPTNRKLSSYPQPLDAIVLAGTHSNPARMILGRNKAFLELDGRPLVRHVVDALLDTESVGNIFVIGPVEDIRDALQGEPAEVHLVPQEGNMLSNCWAGVHASESYQAGNGRERDPMRPYLVISSDLPLVSAASLDDFVARCADDDQASETPYGLLVGLADEQGLAPFSEGGIVRPFVELEFARVRLANIYVARPWQLGNQEFLQTGSGFRKAIHWRNVAGLAYSFLSQEGGLEAAWMTLHLQATLLTARRGGRVYRFLRSRNTRERVEKCTSKVLGGPLRLVITPFGGLSLDVDDEEDFRIFSERYDEWMRIHYAVRSEYAIGTVAEDQSG